MELYHSQRAMRAMRSAALQRGVIAVLDVGTSKIGCLILKFDGTGEKIDGDGVGSLAGQSGFQVIGSALTKSRGIEHGEIVSMPETERAIRTALQSAQKLANSRVDHVIACVSGGSPRSYGLKGGVDIKSEIVDETDIADVIGSCGIPAFEPDREILHAQPVNFSLDHRTGLSDPRGQIGKNLSVDMHMLSIKEKTIQDLLTLLLKYKEIFKKNNIENVHYIATSALRDTKNSQDITDLLKDNDIDLKIISGDVEASLLSEFISMISSFSKAKSEKISKTLLLSLSSSWAIISLIVWYLS